MIIVTATRAAVKFAFSSYVHHSIAMRGEGTDSIECTNLSSIVYGLLTSDDLRSLKLLIWMNVAGA
jgi:hypothetical protein